MQFIIIRFKIVLDVILPLKISDRPFNLPQINKI